MERNNIIQIFAGILILLFAYTGLNKLLSPGIMEMDLSKPEQLHILKWFAKLLSYVIPIAELIIAFLLLTLRFRKIGFLSSFILMIVFSAYVGYIIFFFQGQRRPCTCGGIFRQLSWEAHFMINVFFTAIAGMGFHFERMQNKNRRPVALTEYGMS